MSEFTITPKDQNSDAAIMREIGQFIRHHRLELNWTQYHLAKKAGVNRTTISDIELGRGCQTLTLIQILRILNKLHVLSAFEIQHQISPIQLAEMEMKRRKKATASKENNSTSQSDW